MMLRIETPYIYILANYYFQPETYINMQIIKKELRT